MLLCHTLSFYQDNIQEGLDLGASFETAAGAMLCYVSKCPISDFLNNMYFINNMNGSFHHYKIHFRLFSQQGVSRLKMTGSNHEGV